MIFQVHELQNELAEEEIILSQIEEELKREKKANVEAEIAKTSLLTKLNEKDELLKYVLILMHENVNNGALVLTTFQNVSHEMGYVYHVSQVSC